MRLNFNIRNLFFGGIEMEKLSFIDALSTSYIRTVEILGHEYSMDQNGIPCKAARESALQKGCSINVNGPAEHNSVLMFAFEMLCNKKLKVGKLDNSIVFASEWWRAVFTEKDEFATITTDAKPHEQGQVIGCALLLWMLSQPQDTKDEYLLSSDHLLKSAASAFQSNVRKIMEQNLLMFMDAFYFESLPEVTEAEICYEDDENAVDAFFDKRDLLEAFACDIPAFSDNGFIPAFPEASADPKIEEEQEQSVLYEQALRGEFILPYPFADHEDAEDIVSHIPPRSLLEGFVPTKEYVTNLKRLRFILNKVVDRLMEGQDYKSAISGMACNMAWFGKPGSGKSFLADALGATLGLPVYHVGCSANTEESDFGLKPIVGKSGLETAATPFWKAYKYGGIVVLEEPNLAKPGVMMGALSQALEKPYILSEDGAHYVQRHPLCVIIAAFNPGQAGTTAQNCAFYNRFGFWEEIEPVSEDERVQTILKMVREVPVNENNKKTVRAFYYVHEDLIQRLAKMDGMKTVSTVISNRSIAAAARDFLLFGNSFKEAALSSMIRPIIGLVQEMADEDTLAEVAKNILDPIIAKLEKGKNYKKDRVAVV